MKHIFVFFFLLIMLLNVAIPAMGQLHGVDKYELAKMSKDDEGKAEKEKEGEKKTEEESLAFAHYSGPKPGAFPLGKCQKSLFPPDDFPVTESYASLPELPPDA